MVKVFITGIAGVLGSSLAELFVEMGFKVAGNDIVRVEEAWRLKDIINEIEYLWKASEDLTPSDVRGSDIVIDAGLATADRPLGTNSPEHTLLGNLLPPLRLLEVVKSLDRKPIVIYPSSFNALYGYPLGTVFTEDLLPNPSTVYGWTKAAAENLYRAYHKSFGVPVVITRVGSCFGPKGRSDELPHRLIIFGLKRRRFVLRSPYAKRLWTYARDAMRFYKTLVEQLLRDPNKFVGLTLHLAGNKGDRIVANVELAQIVKKFVPDLEWVEGDYEPGELVNGKPIDFKIDSSFTRKLLGWEPVYSLEEGIRETVKWFEDNLWWYI